MKWRALIVIRIDSGPLHSLDGIKANLVISTYDSTSPDSVQLFPTLLKNIWEIVFQSDIKKQKNPDMKRAKNQRKKSNRFAPQSIEISIWNV